MSYRTFNRSGYSPHTRISVILAGLFVLFSHLAAWSQQPQVSPVKGNNYSTNTPKQVTVGTATVLQPYDPNSKLRLAISIKAPKMVEEEKFLKNLQDKNSPSFKKYLTPEQWNARFAPSAQDEQSVVDWATSQGLTVTARYPNRLMVNVEGTVDTIQKAFNIKINRYQVDGAVEFSNDRDPEIPGNLAGIIEYVDGLNSILRMVPANTNFKGMRGPDYTPGPVRQNGPSLHGNATAPPSKSSSATKLPKGVGSQVTNGWYDPSDIYSSDMYDFNALQAQGHCCNPYHTSGYDGGGPVETSIGLATDGDFANSDIYGFQAQYPYLALFTHRVWVNGTPSCCSDESTLDLEWSLATSNSFGSEFDTAQVFDYEAAQGFGDFGTVFQQMVNDNLVRVVNISYGLNENYLNGFGLVSSWHSIFNQMLGQGMTVMAAAGDNGAATGCGDAIAVIYPGSDPDVVSVGGTQLALNSDGSFNSEVTWTGDNYSGACTSNHGGTGGGCSSLFAAPGYQQSPFQSGPVCGSGSRSLPDIALNASSHTAQNYFFNGTLSGVAGTSIAAPMVSGFVSQADAYLLAIGLGGAPIGQLNYKLYWLGTHGGNSYEAHYPFYDVTSGCNSNDVTNFYGLGSYCAGTGYDVTTGWGSFNALQLSWAINTYDLGDFGAPVITFSGPSHTQGADNWYNTDQTVSWTVADTGSGYTPTGVSGFSQAWDSAFSDPTSEATPGAGNSFYSGPEFPNATSGYLQLSWAGQGCHYATVDAWDNSGITSGNQYYYYLCYDTVAPNVSAANSPSPNSHGYEKQTVTVQLTASDPGSGASGIKKTYYAIDTTACTSSSLGSCAVYSGPIKITATGTHYVAYFTQDVAGNFSGENFDFVYIDEVAPVSKIALAGSVSGSVYDSAVKATLSATDNYSGVQNTNYSVDGGANVTYSSPFTVSALGTHTIKYFSVDYAGNTEATRSTTFTIDSPTTTTLSASANPSYFGEKVMLTAKVVDTLSGTPTGTVTFKNAGATIGTGTLSGGIATFSTTSLPFGTDALSASYAGSGNSLASNTSTYYELVKSQTTTTLASSVNPSAKGQSVTFKATVKATTGSTPTGTVTFKDGSTTLGSITLSGGSASYTTSALPAGSLSITASYSGSGSDDSSVSSTLTQKVEVPTVSLSRTEAPFGNEKVGSTSAVKTAVVKNTGTVELIFSSIKLTGTNANQFTENNNCGATLAPSASCTVNLFFKPTAKGNMAATLDVSDNGSGSPQTVGLTGTGD